MEKIHLIVSHIPAGLFLSACLFSLAGIITKRSLFKEIIFYNIFTGLIFSFGSIITGWTASSHLHSTISSSDLLLNHEKNGYIITALFLILTVWLGVRKAGMKLTEYLAFVSILCMGGFSTAYEYHTGNILVYTIRSGPPRHLKNTVHYNGSSTVKTETEEEDY